MRSMTGFGSGEAFGDGIRVVVEVKSVNSRFCDVNVRLPRPIPELELRLAEAVRRRVSRGRVDLLVSWEWDEAAAPALNLSLARSYYSRLLELKRELGLKGDPELGLLLQFPDIFKGDPGGPELRFLLPPLEEALERALAELESARAAEGERIRSDLARRVGLVEAKVAEVEELAPRQLEKVKRRLEGNLRTLGVSDPDGNRISMEAAIWADRLDITEECLRLRSHCERFLDLLSSEGAVGKALGFLLQEMNREANTIGSKSADAEISQLSASIKEEVEKMREQVQNVE